MSDEAVESGNGEKPGGLRHSLPDKIGSMSVKVPSS